MRTSNLMQNHTYCLTNDHNGVAAVLQVVLFVEATLVAVELIMIIKNYKLLKHSEEFFFGSEYKNKALKTPRNKDGIQEGKICGSRWWSNGS